MEGLLGSLLYFGIAILVIVVAARFSTHDLLVWMLASVGVAVSLAVVYFMWVF